MPTEDPTPLPTGPVGAQPEPVVIPVVPDLDTLTEPLRSIDLCEGDAPE